MMPPGTAGSVAAATAALAMPWTLVGGTKAAPAKGMLARDLVGRKPSAFSKGTPASQQFKIECSNSGLRAATFPLNP